ncbi:MAG: hypothetical protein ABI910_11865 [Gemmatimonadota bacterium]
MIRRVSSLIVVLWFALNAGAPQLLHPCPQHAVPAAWGGAMGAGVLSRSSMSAPNGTRHTDVAADRATHAHGAHQSSGIPGQEKKHECCCPGPQCGSSAASVAVQVSWIFVSLVDATITIAAPPLESPSPRVAYTLPYATAPPAARAA